MSAGFQIEAYHLILATWNFAYFRYILRSFDLAAFQDIIRSTDPVFKHIARESLQTVDIDRLKKDIEAEI